MVAVAVAVPIVVELTQFIRQQEDKVVVAMVYLLVNKLKVLLIQSMGLMV